MSQRGLNIALKSPPKIGYISFQWLKKFGFPFKSLEMSTLFLKSSSILFIKRVVFIKKKSLKSLLCLRALKYIFVFIVV